MAPFSALKLSPDSVFLLLIISARIAEDKTMMSVWLTILCVSRSVEQRGFFS
jgi:hypothetical protein